MLYSATMLSASMVFKSQFKSQDIKATSHKYAQGVTFAIKSIHESGKYKRVWIILLHWTKNNWYFIKSGELVYIDQGKIDC